MKAQSVIMICVTWLAASLLLAACSPPPTPTAHTNVAPGAEHDAEDAPLLSAVELAPSAKVRVVATTNIVADVVRQIGGGRVELTALLPPGADPHSYQATPDDLRQLNGAHVIFVNGLHLEEAMAPILENLDAPTPVVSVNAGVTTRSLGAEDHAEEHGDEDDAANGAHDHEGDDPHTWMNPVNVMVWSENIAHTLGALDPANAAAYAAAAAAYVAELEQLDTDMRTKLAAIPAPQRKLVTDHDNLAYLADAYGFTVLGAVIPSLSTMAAPSAQEMAALQDQIQAEDVKVILVGNTVNPATAQQLAQDTGARVVAIYTDSLSDAAGPAATYIAMMRHNLEQISAAFAE
jgi:manganese/iron transport system substrate-binding protein